MVESGEEQPVPNKRKESFTTIDDCLLFVGKLYKGLIELSNRKRPLDIRKGVISMYNEKKIGEVLKIYRKTF